MSTETQGPRKLATLDKVLIGCGLGCGAVILLAFLAGAMGTMWFFSPGEQVATEAIVGEESLGVVRLHDLAEDPGAQALIGRFFTRVDEIQRERQREDLPPSMRWLSDLQAQQPGRMQGLGFIIPREITIAFERDEDEGGVDFVAAANPRAMTRIFKSMFDLIGQEVRSEHLGHAVYRLEDDLIVAFVRNTVLVSGSDLALRRAIDRVETGEAAATPLAPGAGPDIEGGWDFEGVMGNEQGFLSELFVDEEDATEAVEANPLEGVRLHFGFDVASANEITGRTILECGDRAASEVWLERLRERYAEWAEALADQGLELETDLRITGRRVESDLRLWGIEEAMDQMLTAFEDSEDVVEDVVD